MDYDSFRESVVAQEKTDFGSDCPNTCRLCDAAVSKERKAKKPQTQMSKLIDLSPRVIAFVFFAMAMNSAMSNFVVAFKWSTISLALSGIVIGKEVFGFLVTFKPGMLALLRRPTPRVHDGISDPFAGDGLLSGLSLSESGKATLAPWIQTLTSLSNLRAAFLQAIACRWGVDTPYLAHEIDLQKIGNLVIVAIDLVIQTQSESKVVNFWLFTSLLTGLFFVCLGFAKHYTDVHTLTGFLNEVQDGKVNHNEVLLALEGVYKMMNGEKCVKSFGKCVEEAEVNQKKKKEEGEKEEKEEKEEEKEETK